MENKGTASPEDVARFTAMADEWWDPAGKFKPLHRFNPVRLDFMRRHFCDYFGRDAGQMAPFGGLSLLDVGSGGGLLSEPLARMGFAVTGLDAGDKNVAVASLHAEKSGVPVTYRAGTPESLAADQLFDVVLCMEVVEHVTDIGLFLSHAVAHLRPGGLFVGATLNRTLKAYALAVIGAEYVLGWLPKGTHDWHKFVKPSEFSRMLNGLGVGVRQMAGMAYSPLGDSWSETTNLDVNYMLVGEKRAA
jgi:2-polyprenyl-6-hydroxyphenyl methylase/3-demethylubiquinone-9 3-methyltransferase